MIRPCGGSKVFSAKIIVNCGGNYSDEIDTLPTPNDSLRFTIQPGRGEYVVFKRKDSGTAGPRRMGHCRGRAGGRWPTLQMSPRRTAKTTPSVRKVLARPRVHNVLL